MGITMSLRNKLIRLAYQNPSLRDDILPMLKESAKKSVLKDSDDGFKYVGIDTYNFHDIESLWDKGSPFHFIKELRYKNLSESEMIVQVFPKKKYAEIHIKGIEDEDESDGNFITIHGITHYTTLEVSTALELMHTINDVRRGRVKLPQSAYWQIVEMG